MAPSVTPSPHRFLAKPQHKILKKDETPRPTSNLKLQHKPAHNEDFLTPNVKPKSKQFAAPQIQLPHKQTANYEAPRVDSAVKYRRPILNDGFATPVSTTSKPHFSIDPQFSTTPKFGHGRPPSPKRPRLHEPAPELHTETERFATPRRFVAENQEPLIEDNGSSPTHFNDYDNDGPAHEHRTPQTTRHSFLSTHTAEVGTDEVSSDHGPLPEPASPLVHRPIFLAPPSPSKGNTSAAPLPEAFSPHRRGQKFVPGGMADVVRSWVLDTSHVGSNARRAGQEGWRVRTLEVCEGGVMKLVRGVGEDGGSVRVCLPCAGGVRGGAEVREGSIILVRGATRNIELEGVVWSVATDWRVERDVG